MGKLGGERGIKIFVAQVCVSHREEKRLHLHFLSIGSGMSDSHRDEKPLNWRVLSIDYKIAQRYNQQHSVGARARASNHFLKSTSMCWNIYLCIDNF